MLRRGGRILKSYFSFILALQSSINEHFKLSLPTAAISLARVGTPEKALLQTRAGVITGVANALLVEIFDLFENDDKWLRFDAF